MLEEPHERVPKLTDLLEFLAQPENEHLWAFLDVKVSQHFFGGCLLLAMECMPSILTEQAFK